MPLLVHRDVFCLDVHLASAKVILYDFFEESTRTNIWRHLADVPTTVDLTDVVHAPLIHEVSDNLFYMHSRTNSQPRKLKYIYVAITRARKRLWIVDSADANQPLMVSTRPNTSSYVVG